MTRIAGAIRQAGAGQSRTKRQTVPSPVNGWNTLDPQSATNVLYASRIVNWFPDDGLLTTRAGTKEYADITGDSGAVETLHEWINGGLSKFIAVTSSKAYDVTDPSSITEVKDSGITSGRWSSSNINGNAVFTNGVDEPWRIDENGDVVAHGFTVASGSTLSSVNKLKASTVHRGRAYFTEKDSSKYWFTQADSVSGDIASVDLAGITPEGGNLLAIGSLTLNTGSGADDLLAFFLQIGQVLLYSGGDPVAGLTHNGTFHLAPIVGDRPFVRVGADLIAITTDGFIPMSQFLVTGGGGGAKLAISNKITPSVKNVLARYGDRDGWESFYYGAANWLAFNIGAYGGGKGLQYVMNTNSGAWTTFEGMRADCWGEYDGKLYYGTSGGKVIEANVGFDDQGDAIRCLVRGAYSYMGSPLSKHVVAVRPHLENRGSNVQVGLGLAVDYQDALEDESEIQLESEGTAWDEGAWDTFAWGSGVVQFNEWQLISAFGAALALELSLNVSGGQLAWFSTDVSYEVMGDGFQ